MSYIVYLFNIRLLVFTHLILACVSPKTAPYLLSNSGKKLKKKNKKTTTFKKIYLFNINIYNILRRIDTGKYVFPASPFSRQTGCV